MYQTRNCRGALLILALLCGTALSGSNEALPATTQLLTQQIIFDD